MSEETASAEMANATGVDTIARLCDDAGATIGDDDGLLLIRFTPEGLVIPHILRMGMMSEGRLEAATPLLYHNIMQARAKISSLLNRRT